MERSSCMDMDMDIEDWELLQVPNDSRAAASELGLGSGKGLLLSEETNLGPAAFVDSRYFVLPSGNQELGVENSAPDAKAAREEEGEPESLVVVFKDIGVDHYSPPELSSTSESIMIPKEGTEEEEEGCVDDDAEEKPCRRWRLVGGTVGALCSIGLAAAAAAAATICVFALGGRRQPSYQTHSQSQRLPFQIYADEKRIKQVMQQATRLNHALTAATGVPMRTTMMMTRTTRADISFRGRYYDGLRSEL